MHDCHRMLKRDYGCYAGQKQKKTKKKNQFLFVFVDVVVLDIIAPCQSKVDVSLSVVVGRRRSSSSREETRNNSPTLQPGPGKIQTPLRIPAPSPLCTRSHIASGRMLIASTALNALPSHRISFPTTSCMICDRCRPDPPLHLLFFVEGEDGSARSGRGDITCTAATGGEAGGAG